MNYRHATKDEVPELYRNFIKKYFPRNEVKPLSNIISMLEKQVYKVVVMEDDTEVVATAFIKILPDSFTCLLDYYAVREDRRNNGLGETFLRKLRESFIDDRAMFIESELPDAAKNDEQKRIRLRRLDFYKRCGAKDSKVITDIFGVKYVNLYMSETELCSDVCCEEIKKIYHSMVPKHLYKLFVRIPYLP